MVGVLRGGGDTKFSMKLKWVQYDLLGTITFLGSVVFKLPVHLVLALVYMEDVVRAIGIPRVISKNGLKM